MPNFDGFGHNYYPNSVLDRARSGYETLEFVVSSSRGVAFCGKGFQHKDELPESKKDNQNEEVLLFQELSNDELFDSKKEPQGDQVLRIPWLLDELLDAKKNNCDRVLCIPKLSLDETLLDPKKDSHDEVSSSSNLWSSREQFEGNIVGSTELDAKDNSHGQFVDWKLLDKLLS